MVVLSSPMPASVGLAEVLSGGLLVAGILLLAGSFLRSGEVLTRSGWIILGVFAYFCTVPTLFGFYHQYPLRDIIRDIVPFLFLTGPAVAIALFVPPRLVDYAIRVFLTGILLVGIVSAIQFRVEIHSLYGSLSRLSECMNNAYQSLAVGSTYSLDDGKSPIPASLIQNAFLKMYEPATFFSAMLLLCYSLGRLVKQRGTWVANLVLLAAGIFCASAYVAMGMRAYTGLLIVVPSLYLLIVAFGDRRTLIRTSVCLLLAMVALSPFVWGLAQIMVAKQLAVGSNGKIEELQAVCSVIFASPQTFTLGIGWGGVFTNPVYLMAPSRYTHSLISFYPLKTGIIGLFLLVLLLYLLVRHCGGFKRFKNSNEHVMVGLCTLAVMIIGMFFQPTYKMLGSGIVLALALLAAKVNDVAGDVMPGPIADKQLHLQEETGE